MRANATAIDQPRLRSQQRFCDERVGGPVGQVSSAIDQVGRPIGQLAGTISQPAAAVAQAAVTINHAASAIGQIDCTAPQVAAQTSHAFRGAA